jgi:hypothetical protein
MGMICLPSSVRMDTPEQSAALLGTMERFNASCNAVVLVRVLILKT